MKTLSIDIETYSNVPLQKTGVYRYVESPNFEILLFAYSVDNQPVQVIDLACGEQIWSYVKKKYKLNVTNFLFLCNCQLAKSFTVISNFFKYYFS